MEPNELVSSKELLLRIEYFGEHMKTLHPSDCTQAEREMFDTLQAIVPYLKYYKWLAEFDYIYPLDGGRSQEG